MLNILKLGIFNICQNIFGSFIDLDTINNIHLYPNNIIHLDSINIIHLDLNIICLDFNNIYIFIHLDHNNIIYYDRSHNNEYIIKYIAR